MISVIRKLAAGLYPSGSVEVGNSSVGSIPRAPGNLAPGSGNSNLRMGARYSLRCRGRQGSALQHSAKDNFWT